MTPLDCKAQKILVATLVSNTAYALIAPFLPLEFEKKGISSSMIGFIFAIYSVAIIICSPFVSIAIPHFGAHRLISGGLFCMGVCFVLLGFIEDMTDRANIMIYALVLRLIQGFSSALV